jgi:hypothetical protein
MACSYILTRRQQYVVIITIGEGIDNSCNAVLKYETVSLIAQSIANTSILYEDYGADEVGEVGIKVLRGGDHRKTVGEQG